MQTDTKASAAGHPAGNRWPSFLYGFVAGLTVPAAALGLLGFGPWVGTRSHLPVSVLDGQPMVPGSVHQAHIASYAAVGSGDGFQLVIRISGQASYKTIRLRPVGALAALASGSAGKLVATVPRLDTDDDSLYEFQSWTPESQLRQETGASKQQ